MSTASPVALSLPFDPSSASVARNRIREWLTGLGQPSEVIEDSRLVVSELVGNAVRHARPLDDGTLAVEWNSDERALDISVSDGGAPTVPRQMDAAEADLSGRGLSIVETLSNRWWLETTPARSTVHALLDLSR